MQARMHGIAVLLDKEVLLGRMEEDSDISGNIQWPHSRFGGTGQVVEQTLG